MDRLGSLLWAQLRAPLFITEIRIPNSNDWKEGSGLAVFPTTVIDTYQKEGLLWFPAIGHEDAVRSVGQPVTPHSQSESRERWRLVLSSPPLFV